jgi:cardiolipin synthase A/B
MVERRFWLILSLSVALLAVWRTQSVMQAGRQPTSYQVVINEWSQGVEASKEWVELLVVNGPLDLRGWNLGDKTPGDLTFADHSLWGHMPTGVMIVVYNGADRDPLLPPDDTGLADCVVVVPHNNGLLFTGSWPGFDNADVSDNPHLRDSAAVTVHNFSTAPGTSRHPGVGQNAAYHSNDTAGIPDPAQWANHPAGSATPGSGNDPVNEQWFNDLCASGREPDLSVAKTGPTTAQAGTTIQYSLTISNAGTGAAPDVLLTDTLPTGLSYLGDNSGLPVQQPLPGLLVWQAGLLPAGASINFQLTASIASNITGSVTNLLQAGTSVTESHTANNNAQTTTTIFPSATEPQVLIEAVLYDGYEGGELDEAVRLMNVGLGSAYLGGWQISDGAAATALPAGTTLLPGQAIWLSASAAGFAAQFGFLPDFEAADSHPSVPQLSGAWPGFSNNGDEVILLDNAGRLMDALVYEGGNVNQPGWSGPAVEPYTVSGIFGPEGQILFRKRDQSDGRPVPDTNSAPDWAQHRADVINGRRVLYPGWDLDAFFFPASAVEPAWLKVAIAPDNAYEALVAEIDSAQSTLQVAIYSFDNVAVADALVAAAGRGVAVTVLLEGEPAGGLTDQGRYVCQILEAAGGQCWFMISEATLAIYDRYRFFHSKYVLVDGQRVIVSSENFSRDSLPNDDKSDGTWGSRGAVLITNAPSVVARVQAIWQADFDPLNHRDLLRWAADHPTYGGPPPGFVPITQTGGITYTVRYPTAGLFQGTYHFELVQAPEHTLRDIDSLLGLLAQAAGGDTILVQQLSERPHWGPSSSTPAADPNPRLEAYLAAARRGAKVRLLLDAYYDDPTSQIGNRATCRYVQDIARSERLDLKCALANPTGLGIHSKMVLVEVDGQGYVHIGSLNGSEQASKGNRELALQVRSNAAYALLAEMFSYDWPHQALFPQLYLDYLGPASYVLISEVLYDPIGPDDSEFIELANPTGLPIDISFFSLGDAVNRDDFEDVRRFPAGTIIPPRQSLVVAAAATAFYARFGFQPDFEIIDSDPAVPDLIDDPTWGDPAAILQLGNLGDEVLLRNPLDQIVDAIAYGSGAVPGVISCPLVLTSGHSLERFPYWRDTNNCLADFRDWPYPSPGLLP